MEHGIYAIGAAKEFLVDDYDELIAISGCVGHAVIINKVLKFKRIRIGRDLIHSAEYTRVFSRNSFTIAFQDENEVSYGQVLYFCQLIDKQDDFANLAVIKYLPIIEGYSIFKDPLTGARGEHIKPVFINAEHVVKKCIKISDILGKVVYLKDTENIDRAFVIPFPNPWEKD